MTPVIEIIRLEENSDYGTFGVLKINKAVFCVTLEPADRLNHPNVSSIPAQQYMCNRIDSPKYGDTFEVSNVPDREHILFHAGNVVDNTKGCILLGQYFGKLQGDRAVLNSGATFKEFMKRIGDAEQFHLTISQRY